jgi:hypothetical protein
MRSYCRRCVAMDVRFDSYNPALCGTPQYQLTTTTFGYISLCVFSAAQTGYNNPYLCLGGTGWNMDQDSGYTDREMLHFFGYPKKCRERGHIISSV